MRRGPRVRPETAFREQSWGGLLSGIRDLMLGGRHNRHTLVRQFGVSLPTADRWLQAFLTIPGMRTFKVSKTRWYEWGAPEPITTPERVVLKEAVAWWERIGDAKPDDGPTDPGAVLDAIKAMVAARGKRRRG